MALYVLSAVGSDRPGLTEALAAAVHSVGGNWLESHLSRLGGLYVGSVLVDLPSESVTGLRAALSALDAHGLEVRIAPALGAAETEGETFEFELVGQDRPGIVREATAVLSANEANIESLETWIDSEAHSGAPLFHAKARVRLPAGLAASAVAAALENLSAEIMVDVSVTSTAVKPN